MDTTTVNSATQAQALALTHPPGQTHGVQKGTPQGSVPRQGPALGDGDGDHGVEPGGTPGQIVNFRA